MTDPGHMRMFTGVMVEADRDPPLRAIVSRETRRLEDVLAELLGGREAKARAGLVLASLWGLGLYELLVRPERGAAFRPALLAGLIPGASASGHGRQPA